MKTAPFLAAVLLSAIALHAGDVPAPAKPAEETPVIDVRSGVAFTLPAGFARLTDDEFRAMTGRLSEHLGKEAGDRLIQRAPLYFKGPITEAEVKQKVEPASMFVALSSGIPLDEKALDTYKQRIQNGLERGGTKHGDIQLRWMKLGGGTGIKALRADLDTFAPDGSHQRMLMILLPGPDRQADIVFNYSAPQAEQIEKASEIVVNSFRFQDAPNLAAAPTRDWTRVAWITGGCFAFGIVLSLLLRKISTSGKSA